MAARTIAILIAVAALAAALCGGGYYVSALRADLRSARAETAEAMRALTALRGSAEISGRATVAQSRAASTATRQRATAARKAKEAAAHDPAHRTWADTPAPAGAFRLLREAAGNIDDSSPGKPDGTMP